MYDGCDWYLQQIGRVPMLTEAEEIERGNQVQAYMAVIEKENHTAAERRIIRRGQKAKDRMINANLRLVVSVSKRYTDKCQILCLDDLIQAGNTGLIRAVEKYDPTRGYRFSTYAYCWIKQGIWRSISYSDTGDTQQLQFIWRGQGEEDGDSIIMAWVTIQDYFFSAHRSAPRQWGLTICYSLPCYH